MTMNSPVAESSSETRAAKDGVERIRVRQHTVEVVSDSGEGAQKCGQIFGAVSAKMGSTPKIQPMRRNFTQPNQAYEAKESK